ncbi:MAG: 4-hydroxy-3-methylbut-2-enyl diphosphate reductase, partial [Bacteroidales bacterium]|nr:4-hydroxy-3-methylbut-2-enyl diphosphate reductase [Bacteroidales bacterium]
MQISIDKNAGFCSGVKSAIQKAEEELSVSGSLYCLGQIVHNEEEELRLKSMGLKVISHDELKLLRNTKVLIRAHGEPPETYSIASQNNIELIDATCPVVLRLQQKIKSSFIKGKPDNTQVVIFGRKNHPEVLGLNGQINNEAILIEETSDMDKIDFSKPVCLFAQTTKDKTIYQEIIRKIEERIKLSQKNNLHFISNNSICGQVSNRDEHLKEFARSSEIIIFVGGQHSSNGKYLFSVCKNQNKNSYYIS